MSIASIIIPLFPNPAVIHISVIQRRLVFINILRACHTHTTLIRLLDSGKPRHFAAIGQLTPLIIAPIHTHILHKTQPARENNHLAWRQSREISITPNAARVNTNVKSLFSSYLYTFWRIYGHTQVYKYTRQVARSRVLSSRKGTARGWSWTTNLSNIYSDRCLYAG